MDADVYPQEVLADEEPKYLRRQKPLEIKRRKFGRKAWMTYLRASLWVVSGLALVGMAYEARGEYEKAQSEYAGMSAQDPVASDLRMMHLLAVCG